MLSYSINHSETKVSWEEELQNTMNYIAIQKVRYGDKFTFTMSYNEAILPVRTPKLLLQPIIENSIYHGLQPKEKTGELKLKLRCSSKSLKSAALIMGLVCQPKSCTSLTAESIHRRSNLPGM